MPPAIPLIAAVAGAAASTTIGGILGSIAGFVVSTAINQIGGRAVSKKPKASSLADAGRDLMLRSSVESHKIVYGRAKVSGPFYAETGDTGPDSSGNVITGKNTFLHMVIPVAGHEVEAFEAIYLNDVALTLDANGFATNAPYGRSDTTSSSTSVTTTNRLIRRVNGTVTVTTSSSHGFSTGDRIEINEVNIAALNGTQTITVTSSTTFTYPSDGPDTNPSSAGISVKSTTVTTTTLRSYVRVKTHVGTTDQVADSFLVNELPNWTSDHRLQGIAYIYCRLEWNPDAFPFDAPNVAAVVRGKKIYDPRTTLTVWSDNAALCVRDYLTSDMGYDCDESKIDDAYFISGANICDEAVTLKDGTVTTRYSANGVLDTANALSDNMTELLSACAGYKPYVKGKHRILPAAYQTVSGSIDVNMLAGTVNSVTRPTRKDLFNAVKGTYVDPDKGYQPTDFPAVTNPLYETQDGGQQLFKDIELPFTSHPESAQRIGKVILEKGRQGISVTVPMNYRGLKYTVGDVVTYSDDAFGWNDKEFLIRQWSFSVRDGVSVVMQEESSASYDWANGEATTVDAAPDTNLPDAFTVTPPRDVAAESGTDQLIVSGDGTVISRIRVSWSPSDNSYVTSGGSTQVQFKKKSATAWQEAPPPIGDSTDTYVTGVDDGADYDLRARFRNAIGVRSDWTQISHTVIGKTQPPADITSFLIEGDRLSWTEVTDKDLAGYLIRFQPGTSRSWGDAGRLHVGLVTASPFTMLTRPSGPVTFMIKARDTSGNESLNPAYIVTDLGDPDVANVLVQYDRKASLWPGILSGGTIDGSNNLAANTGTLMWNINPAANMWASDSSSLMWNIVYDAMTYVDQLTVTSALSGSAMTIAAAILGDPWSVQYRENAPALIWDADGATLMWDADSSSPMWDTPDWQAWPGRIEAKNTIYDFLLTTGQSPTQGYVSQFVITLDAPDVEETLDDVAVSALGTRLPITKTYSVITNVQLTVQTDGGGAVSARYADKDAVLGPLVQCLDAAGTPVAGILDARIKGY